MAKDIDLAGIVQQVYKVVASLTSDQRSRVIRSVSALFDEAAPSFSGAGGKGNSGAAERSANPPSGKYPPAAATWMSRNGITTDHIEQLFHIEDGKVSIIADSVPGKGKKEQTVNCYVLEGVRSYLESGSAKFIDSDADSLCDRMGCRDKTNHAAYRSSAGNKLAGSRKDGYTLIAPGLKFAVELIKGMAASGDANSSK